MMTEMNGVEVGSRLAAATLADIRPDEQDGVMDGRRQRRDLHLQPRQHAHVEGRERHDDRACLDLFLMRDQHLLD